MHKMQGTTFKINPFIKREIVKIVDERIMEAHVTREDFSELKSIVRELAEAQKDLAEAQKRTEQRVNELAEAQKDLAEAQKKTEQRVNELAEAHRELAEETKKLAIGLNRTREDLGGVTRTLGYAFENEAYRMLSRLLKERYALELKDKMVRAEVGGKEINFFGKAEKGGKEVYIVGEAKVRLDETKKRGDVFKEIEEKVKAVKAEYKGAKVMPLLVPHFATKGFLNKAQKRGIIVVQSYEWN